jgi:hypothetical protein
MARQFGFYFLFLLLWANYLVGAELPLEEQLRELRENYVRNLNIFKKKKENY